VSQRAHGADYAPKHYSDQHIMRINLKLQKTITKQLGS
jgi:hypothetical protein